MVLRLFHSCNVPALIKMTNLGFTRHSPTSFTAKHLTFNYLKSKHVLKKHVHCELASSCQLCDRLLHLKAKKSPTYLVDLHVPGFEELARLLREDDLEHVQSRVKGWGHL
jgi:hypothetical protein